MPPKIQPIALDLAARFEQKLNELTTAAGRFYQGDITELLGPHLSDQKKKYLFLFLFLRHLNQHYLLPANEKQRVACFIATACCPISYEPLLGESGLNITASQAQENIFDHLNAVFAFATKAKVVFLKEGVMGTHTTQWADVTTTRVYEYGEISPYGEAGDTENIIAPLDESNCDLYFLQKILKYYSLEHVTEEYNRLAQYPIIFQLPLEVYLENPDWLINENVLEILQRAPDPTSVVALFRQHGVEKVLNILFIPRAMDLIRQHGFEEVYQLYQSHMLTDAVCELLLSPELDLLQFKKFLEEFENSALLLLDRYGHQAILELYRRNLLTEDLRMFMLRNQIDWDQLQILTTFSREKIDFLLTLTTTMGCPFNEALELLQKPQLQSFFQKGNEQALQFLTEVIRDGSDLDHALGVVQLPGVAGFLKNACREEMQFFASALRRNLTPERIFSILQSKSTKSYLKSEIYRRYPSLIFVLTDQEIPVETAIAILKNKDLCELLVHFRGRNPILAEAFYDCVREQLADANSLIGIFKKISLKDFIPFLDRASREYRSAMSDRQENLKQLIAFYANQSKKVTLVFARLFDVLFKQDFALLLSYVQEEASALDAAKQEVMDVLFWPAINRDLPLESCFEIIKSEHALPFAKKANAAVVKFLFDTQELTGENFPLLLAMMINKDEFFRNLLRDPRVIALYFISDLSRSEAYRFNVAQNCELMEACRSDQASFTQVTQTLFGPFSAAFARDDWRYEYLTIQRQTDPELFFQLFDSAFDNLNPLKRYEQLRACLDDQELAERAEAILLAHTKRNRVEWLLNQPHEIAVFYINHFLEHLEGAAILRLAGHERFRNIEALTNKASSIRLNINEQCFGTNAMPFSDEQLALLDSLRRYNQTIDELKIAIRNAIKKYADESLTFDNKTNRYKKPFFSFARATRVQVVNDLLDLLKKLHFADDVFNYINAHREEIGYGQQHKPDHQHLYNSTDEILELITAFRAQVIAFQAKELKELLADPRLVAQILMDPTDLRRYLTAREFDMMLREKPRTFCKVAILLTETIPTQQALSQEDYELIAKTSDERGELEHLLGNKALGLPLNAIFPGFHHLAAGLSREDRYQLQEHDFNILLEHLVIKFFPTSTPAAVTHEEQATTADDNTRRPIDHMRLIPFALPEAEQDPFFTDLICGYLGASRETPTLFAGLYTSVQDNHHRSFFCYIYEYKLFVLTVDPAPRFTSDKSATGNTDNMRQRFNHLAGRLGLELQLTETSVVQQPDNRSCGYCSIKTVEDALETANTDHPVIQMNGNEGFRFDRSRLTLNHEPTGEHQGSYYYDRALFDDAMRVRRDYDVVLKNYSGRTTKLTFYDVRDRSYKFNSCPEYPGSDYSDFGTHFDFNETRESQISTDECDLLTGKILTILSGSASESGTNLLAAITEKFVETLVYPSYDSLRDIIIQALEQSTKVAPEQLELQRRAEARLKAAKMIVESEKAARAAKGGQVSKQEETQLLRRAFDYVDAHGIAAEAPPADTAESSNQTRIEAAALNFFDERERLLLANENIMVGRIAQIIRTRLEQGIYPILQNKIIRDLKEGPGNYSRSEVDTVILELLTGNVARYAEFFNKLSPEDQARLIATIKPEVETRIQADKYKLYNNLIKHIERQVANKEEDCGQMDPSELAQEIFLSNESAFSFLLPEHQELVREHILQQVQHRIIKDKIKGYYARLNEFLTAHIRTLLNSAALPELDMDAEAEILNTLMGEESQQEIIQHLEQLQKDSCKALIHNLFTLEKREFRISLGRECEKRLRELPLDILRHLAFETHDERQLIEKLQGYLLPEGLSLNYLTRTILLNCFENSVPHLLISQIKDDVERLKQETKVTVKNILKKPSIYAIEAVFNYPADLETALHPHNQTGGLKRYADTLAQHTSSREKSVQISLGHLLGRCELFHRQISHLFSFLNDDMHAAFSNALISAAELLEIKPYLLAMVNKISFDEFDQIIELQWKKLYSAMLAIYREFLQAVCAHHFPNDKANEIFRIISLSLHRDWPEELPNEVSAEAREQLTVKLLDEVKKLAQSQRNAENLDPVIATVYLPETLAMEAPAQFQYASAQVTNDTATTADNENETEVNDTATAADNEEEADNLHPAVMETTSPAMAARKLIVEVLSTVQGNSYRDMRIIQEARARILAMENLEGIQLALREFFIQRWASVVRASCSYLTFPMPTDQALIDLLAELNKRQLLNVVGKPYPEAHPYYTWLIPTIANLNNGSQYPIETEALHRYILVTNDRQHFHLLLNTEVCGAMLKDNTSKLINPYTGLEVKVGSVLCSPQLTAQIKLQQAIIDNRNLVGNCKLSDRCLKAIEDFVNAAVFHYGLGAYYRQGDNDSLRVALLELTRAISILDPRESEAFYNYVPATEAKSNATLGQLLAATNAGSCATYFGKHFVKVLYDHYGSNVTNVIKNEGVNNWHTQFNWIQNPFKVGKTYADLFDGKTFATVVLRMLHYYQQTEIGQQFIYNDGWAAIQAPTSASVQALTAKLCQAVFSTQDSAALHQTVHTMLAELRLENFSAHPEEVKLFNSLKQLIVSGHDWKPAAALLDERAINLAPSTDELNMYVMGFHNFPLSNLLEQIRVYIVAMSSGALQATHPDELMQAVNIYNQVQEMIEEYKGKNISREQMTGKIKNLITPYATLSIFGHSEKFKTLVRGIGASFALSVEPETVVEPPRQSGSFFDRLNIF